MRRSQRRRDDTQAAAGPDLRCHRRLSEIARARPSYASRACGPLSPRPRSAGESHAIVGLRALLPWRLSLEADTNGSRQSSLFPGHRHAQRRSHRGTRAAREWSGVQRSTGISNSACGARRPYRSRRHQPRRYLRKTSASDALVVGRRSSSAARAGAQRYKCGPMRGAQAQPHSSAPPHAPSASSGTACALLDTVSGGSGAPLARGSACQWAP